LDSRGSFRRLCRIHIVPIRWRLSREHPKDIISIQGHFIKEIWFRALLANAKKKDDKFLTNWESPFKVLDDVGKGDYKLKKLFGEPVPNT